MAAGGFTKDTVGTLPPAPFAFGAFIGVADLVDVSPLNVALEQNPWATGPYCWHFANPRQFSQPIAVSGKLRLFAIPTNLVRETATAITRAGTTAFGPAETTWISRIRPVDAAEVRRDKLFEGYLALADAENLARLAEHGVAQNGDAKSFVDRAIAKHMSEDSEGALADVNRAIELDPMYARAYQTRGVFHKYGGKPGLAARDQRKAAKLDGMSAARPAPGDEVD